MTAALERDWTRVLTAAKRSASERVELLVASWTYDVELADGKRLRHLAPSEAYAVVASVLGVAPQTLRSEVAALAAARDSGYAAWVETGRRLLEAVPEVVRATDFRTLSGRDRSRSVFQPDPTPDLLVRPPVVFAWTSSELSAHPFLRVFEQLWMEWLRTNTPNDQQLYRKLLMELYPSFRAGVAAGVGFSTPPDSRFVKCVGAPLRSDEEYARQAAPFLVYERTSGAADRRVARGALAFIVEGDPYAATT